MNLLVGCALVIVTTVTHAVAMVGVMKSLRLMHARRWVRISALTRVTFVALVVLVMFLATVVESGLWAMTYLAVGALSDFEEAAYFSTVTYTTLGYGDVTMEGRWRLLSAFEAANGIIMFGWTTAVIVAAVQRVYFPHGVPDDPAAEEKIDV